MTQPDSPTIENTLPDLQTAGRHAPSHARLWIVAAVGLFLDLWTKHWAFTSPTTDKEWVIVEHLVTFQRSLNTGALFGLGKGWTPLFIGASVLALLFVLYLFIHSTRDRRSLHIALGLVLAGALGNLYDRAYTIADVVRFSNDGRRIEIVGQVMTEEEIRETHLFSRFREGDIVIRDHRDGQPRQIRQALGFTHHQQGVVRDFIRMEPSIPIGDKRVDIWPWVFNLADAWLVVGVGLLMLNFWHDRKLEQAMVAEEPPIAPD